MTAADVAHVHVALALTMRAGFPVLPQARCHVSGASSSVSLPTFRRRSDRGADRRRNTSVVRRTSTLSAFLRRRTADRLNGHYGVARNGAAKKFLPRLFALVREAQFSEVSIEHKCPRDAVTPHGLEAYAVHQAEIATVRRE